MKRWFIWLFLGSLSGSVSAQMVLQDSSKYFKGIQMIASADSELEYQDAAEYFVRLSVEDSFHWLPHYYAGLCYTLSSDNDNEPKRRDQVINKAQHEVDQGLAISPSENELLILQAFVYQARILVHPLVRGLNYSLKAGSVLDKVLESDPGNPRALMLKGYNTYYTPAIAGGGPEKALPFFLEAQKNFGSFKPTSEITPRWGEKQTIEMIGNCRHEMKVGNAAGVSR